MTIRPVIPATVAGLLLMAGPGCNNDDKPGATPTPTTERASLTRAECEARGGRVVGDIGDGATQRPDYKCEGGQAPLGNIKAAEGEPVAVEGAVCCP